MPSQAVGTARSPQLAGEAAERIVLQLHPMLAAKSREELAGFPGKSRVLVDRLLDQRDTLRFSADCLPRFSTISYSITCPSLRELRPARSTAEI
jgi:hypothetical protein